MERAALAGARAMGHIQAGAANAQIPEEVLPVIVDRKGTLMKTVTIVRWSLLVCAPFLATARPSRAQLAVPPIRGISCDAQEGTRIHVHQHLLILDHGKPLSIPHNVGQRPENRCLYWVHTHTPDGIIHIEAPADRTFTLGDFFAVWGQPLTKRVAATARAGKGTSLRVWVDDKPYKGDPATIALKSHTTIVIEAGPPFPTPPRFTAWGRITS